MPRSRARAIAGDVGRPRVRSRSTARTCLAGPVLAWAAVLLAGCGRTLPEGPSVRVVDLVKQVGHVDMRPLGAEVRPAEHTFGGHARASLVVPVPSRLAWKTTLPDRAVLHAIAALPDDRAPSEARFRIGISDDRFYESLVEWIPAANDGRPVWKALAVDLTRFSGRRLSVLFNPAGRTWRITLSIDPITGSGVACWADVGIDTDAQSARAYFGQRAAPARDH